MRRTYTSPDGLLTLLVEPIENGDWAIGFDGFPWHIHPDQLLRTYGETAEHALENFVSAILNSKEVILVTRRDGKVVDAFVSDNLPLSLECLRGEDVELRYWDGRHAQID